MIDLKFDIQGATELNRGMTLAPIEIKAGLFGATVIATSQLLALIEAAEPRRTGVMAGETQARVHEHDAEDRYVGVVFTPADYARFPEAGPFHQRAQRFFGHAGAMESPAYAAAVSAAVRTALNR